MSYFELVKLALDKAYEGEYEEAIKLYEEAFTEEVAYGDYCNYAICLQAVKNFEKAETVLFEILEYHESSSVYQLLAMNYASIAQFVEAIDYFKKAIELDPTNTDARLSLSGLYEEFDECELAKEQYLKVLEYEPDNFWCCLNLGSYYEKSNELDKSYFYLSRALEINPDEKMINYNLGVYYVRTKDFDKAKYYYLEEIKNPECYPYAYLNLALLYKDVYKDNEKSKETYLKGIEVFPDVSELWYNLACLFVLEGNNKAAVVYFEKAFNLDKEIIEFSKTDKELDEFRLTSDYMKLINT